LSVDQYRYNSKLNVQLQASVNFSPFASSSLQETKQERDKMKRSPKQTVVANKSFTQQVQKVKDFPRKFMKKKLKPKPFE